MRAEDDTIPLTRLELMASACEYGMKRDEALTTPVVDLRHFLSTKNAAWTKPAQRSQALDRPHPTTSQTPSTRPAQNPEEASAEAGFSMHAFLERGDFDDAVKRIEQKDGGSRPRVRPVRIQRISVEQRVRELIRHHNELLYLYNKALVARSIMQFDNYYTEECLTTYDQLIIKRSGELDDGKKELADVFAEYQECLRVRAENDAKMLKEGLADADTVLSWRERRAAIQDEVRSLRDYINH